MRVLICGSRDWADRAIVHHVLAGLYEQAMNDVENFSVIHGACNTKLDTRAEKTPGIGADAYAHEWCSYSPGYVSELAFPADWEQHGKRAGFIRNARMLDEAKPDLVIGFTNDPPSRGTTIMLDLAKRAGVTVYRVQEWA